MFLVIGKKDNVISVLDTDDMKVDNFSKHELRDISSRYKLNIVGNITNIGFIDIKYINVYKRGKRSWLVASESADNYELFNLSVQGIFMSGEINLKVSSLYNTISGNGFYIGCISDIENLCKFSKLDGIKCLVIRYVYAWKVLGYNKNILNDILADLYINKALHEISEVWTNEFLMSIKDSIAIFEDNNFAYFTNNKDIIICMKKSMLNRYTKQDIKITKAIVLRKNIKYDEKTNKFIIQSCDKFLVKNDGLTYLYTPSCNIKELIIDEGAKLVLTSGKYDTKSCKIVCKDKNLFLKLKSKMPRVKFRIPLEFINYINVDCLSDLTMYTFLDTNDKELCLALYDKLLSFINDRIMIKIITHTRLNYFENYLKANGVDNNLCSRFDFEYDAIKLALQYLELFKVKVFYDLRPFMNDGAYTVLLEYFGQSLLILMEYGFEGFFIKSELINKLTKLPKSDIDNCLTNHVRLYSLLNRFNIYLEKEQDGQKMYIIKFSNFSYKHLIYKTSKTSFYLLSDETLSDLELMLSSLEVLDSVITNEVEFSFDISTKVKARLHPTSVYYDTDDLVKLIVKYELEGLIVIRR